MGIMEILADEAAEKRAIRRKKIGIYDASFQPQTMSLDEVRHILGFDGSLIKNDQYPQIVDIDEF